MIDKQRLKDYVSKDLITQKQADAIWEFEKSSSASSRGDRLSRFLYYIGGGVIISAIIYFTFYSWNDWTFAERFGFLTTYFIAVSVTGYYLLKNKIWVAADLMILGSLGLATIILQLIITEFIFPSRPYNPRNLDWAMSTTFTLASGLSLLYVKFLKRSIPLLAMYVFIAGALLYSGFRFVDSYASGVNELPFVLTLIYSTGITALGIAFLSMKMQEKSSYPLVIGAIVNIVSLLFIRFDGGNEGFLIYLVLLAYALGYFYAYTVWALKKLIIPGSILLFWLILDVTTVYFEDSLGFIGGLIGGGILTIVAGIIVQRIYTEKHEESSEKEEKPTKAVEDKKSEK